MPPEVVAVPESFVAVAADEWRFALVFLFDRGHRATSTGVPAPTARPAGYVVLEELGGADRGLVVQWYGHHRFLVGWVRV